MLATSSTALWMEYELQARALSLGVHWKMTTGDAVSQSLLKCETEMVCTALGPGC